MRPDKTPARQYRARKGTAVLSLIRLYQASFVRTGASISGGARGIAQFNGNVTWFYVMRRNATLRWIYAPRARSARSGAIVKFVIVSQTPPNVIMQNNVTTPHIVLYPRCCGTVWNCSTHSRMPCMSPGCRGGYVIRLRLLRRLPCTSLTTCSSLYVWSKRLISLL